MNQLSYERFRPRLRADGLLVLNSSGGQTSAELESASRAKVLRIPAAEAAVALGDIRVANVLLLGAYSVAQGSIRMEDVMASLERELGPSRAKLMEINRRAFVKGRELAANGG